MLESIISLINLGFSRMRFLTALRKLREIPEAFPPFDCSSTVSLCAPGIRFFSFPIQSPPVIQKHRTIARCLCALWGYSNDKRKENGCDGRTRTSSLKDMSLASCHCSTPPERVRAPELIGCCTFPALFLIVIIAHLTGKHQHTFAHILTESIAFGRT